jgi:hypothetical protein
MLQIICEQNIQLMHMTFYLLVYKIMHVCNSGNVWTTVSSFPGLE